VVLKGVRTDGVPEASEVVGRDGEDPGVGGGPDATTTTKMVALAGTPRGPVDPVAVAVGGPFTNLALDAGALTWNGPAGPGRVDLRAPTTLPKPPHPLGPCALLTPAELHTALDVFRGAFESSVELFPNATPAGLEALAADVLANVGD
jgi:hypothetical protein